MTRRLYPEPIRNEFGIAVDNRQVSNEAEEEIDFIASFPDVTVLVELTDANEKVIPIPAGVNKVQLLSLGNIAKLGLAGNLIDPFTDSDERAFTSYARQDSEIFSFEGYGTAATTVHYASIFHPLAIAVNFWFA